MLKSHFTGIGKQVFFPFFSQDNDLVYCNNIIGLLLKMKIPNYKPEDWRLFIDSSKRSLKCVLLHYGNGFASTPIAHSTKLKEEYDNIKTVLQRICYEEHQWSICVDLKMVNFFAWTTNWIHQVSLLYVFMG